MFTLHRPHNVGALQVLWHGKVKMMNVTLHHIACPSVSELQVRSGEFSRRTTSPGGSRKGVSLQWAWQLWH